MLTLGAKAIEHVGDHVADLAEFGDAEAARGAGRRTDADAAGLGRRQRVERDAVLVAGDAGALERAGITCNKNGIPFDPLPPTKTSGIRVGSPAGTTRGFGVAEFREIGDMIADVLDGLRAKGEHGDPEVEAAVRLRVEALCDRFPIYPEL